MTASSAGSLRAVQLVVPAAATGDDRADVIDRDGALVLVLADGAAGGARAAEAVVAAMHRFAGELVTGATSPARLLADLDRELAHTRGAEHDTSVLTPAVGCRMTQR